MQTIYSNVHEVFRCLKHTSILNVYNLHGNIFIFGLIFILKFENLATLKFFFVTFWVWVIHKRFLVMVFDGCMCG
jgi:hypothetical protein